MGLHGDSGTGLGLGADYSELSLALGRSLLYRKRLWTYQRETWSRLYRFVARLMHWRDDLGGWLVGREAAAQRLPRDAAEGVACQRRHAQRLPRRRAHDGRE